MFDLSECGGEEDFCEFLWWVLFLFNFVLYWFKVVRSDFMLEESCLFLEKDIDGKDNVFVRFIESLLSFFDVICGILWCNFLNLLYLWNV